MTDTVVKTDLESGRKSRLSPEIRRGLLGLGLGNTLEWYDWMVFGLLSAFIGPKFFPSRTRLPQH